MRIAWLGAAAAVSVAASGATTAAHADAPHMLKGPYLQDLAPTSITVMWQLDQAAPARVTVTGPGGPGSHGGPGGTRTLDVAAARVGEATIDHLTPSSRYRYRVDTAGHSWSGEFATAPEVGADAPFSFIVMGDTRNGVDAHRRVIERMAQEVPDFVLGTGDMVDDGYRQDQWQQFFDIETPLLRDNVYFPAVGNHDRQGRGRTADSYRLYFSVPDNGGDTSRYYGFSYAAARFLVLDSNEYSYALSDQSAWLERELIAARQDPAIRHVFAVMHHPPFSISLHGGNRDLRERWAPLFEKYQVTAVFSGHDHVYERAEHNGIRYFVSGGGGAPLYPRRPHPSPVDLEAVKKFERSFHFLRVTVTGSRVEVTGVRSDGTVIETTAWGEGPHGEARPQLAMAIAGAGAGAAARAAPPRPPSITDAPPQLAEPAEPDPGALVWVGVGGVGLMLAAAVVVVRTLRR